MIRTIYNECSARNSHQNATLPIVRGACEEATAVRTFNLHIQKASAVNPASDERKSTSIVAFVLDLSLGIQDRLGVQAGENTRHDKHEDGIVTPAITA